MTYRYLIFGLLVCLLVGCGGGQTQVEIGNGAKAGKTNKSTAEKLGGATAAFKTGECKADAPDLESSEYDTSGDDKADVYKVFRRIGIGSSARLVLVCREADLNGDGVKDVVRFYDSEGKPLREEADRNFDGKVDEISYFENGEMTHREIDENGDGIVDLKIFYEKGVPLRAERDVSKHSTATSWKPDQWEYYEDGKLVRIGTDLTGDGRADRWDRGQEKQEAIDTSSVAEQPPPASQSGSSQSQGSAMAPTTASTQSATPKSAATKK